MRHQKHTQRSSWAPSGWCWKLVEARFWPQPLCKWVIGLHCVSLAFGLTVLTMVFAIGHISGCNLNPAISLGLWAAGRVDAGKLLP